MNNFNEWITIINLAGFGILGVSMFYNNWRKGTNNVEDKVLSLYKEQITALEADIVRARERSHELGNQIQTLSIEVGKLRGEIVARDKQLDDYKQIFQNRDPQLLEILTQFRDYMIRNEQRNTRIDKSTKAEKGKVLRSEI